MAAKPCVVLIGTCDTKLQELLFTRRQIERAGNINVKLLDVGRTPSKDRLVDMSSSELLSHLPKNEDEALDVPSLARGEVIKKMIEACTIVLRDLHAAGSIHAVMALGGSGGTSLAASAMRVALPIGLPKMIVSTVASGDTSSFIGESDITMVPSIVDIAGLNSMLRTILDNAAAAIAGMARLNFERTSSSTPTETGDAVKKSRIAISMFGVTTPAATTAMEYLSSRGHEVFTFHATGTGGRAMERLISEGHIDAVLDLTTTEMADELIGGIMSSGPERLKAAGKQGLPQIVSLGALDIVNFGPRASVPEKFQTGRDLYEHNPSITLMRTTPEECTKLGERISHRLRETCKNLAQVEVWIPLRGISMIAEQGGPFYNEPADKALFEAIRKGLDGSGIKVQERENTVNDPEFATAIARRLLELMNS